MDGGPVLCWVVRECKVIEPKILEEVHPYLVGFARFSSKYLPSGEDYWREIIVIRNPVS